MKINHRNGQPYRLRLKWTFPQKTALVPTRVRGSDWQGTHRGNTLKTHQHHHHDVYRHASSGATAPAFCVNSRQFIFKGIVQHFWKLARCHDPSSHSSRFVTFNYRSKLLDWWSWVLSGTATLWGLMEFLGFPHQTKQIHNQKTTKRCGGQVVTCTFTTLWDNNRTLRNGVVLEVKSDFTLQTQLLVISKAHIYCRYFRQQNLWRSEVWSWQTVWWTMRTTF